MEAILQSPDDDALRLIFADWLEERGDPRGEFIRVQYALLDEKLDERKRFELKTREQELVAEHGRKWAGPVHDLVPYYLFRGGFVEHVSLDAECFVQSADLLFENSPVRSIQIDPPTFSSAACFECPQLACVEELDLTGNALGDLGMHRLAECTYLRNLRSLTLSLNEIGLDGARTLATSSALPNLRHLSVNGNPIENLGFQALCASESLTRLSALEVEACQIDISGLRGAAKQFRLSNLEELHLGRNSIDRQALAVLATVPFSGLQSLHLNDLSLNSTAIQPLTHSAIFRGLKELNLQRNLLSDLAAQNLANSPILANLNSLVLHGNRISRSGRQNLIARFGDAVSF